jgi:plasmid stabilization system protein ParE
MKVDWTVTAAKQRNEVLAYWNRRNNDTRYSKKLKAEIRFWTSQLKIHPELGRATDFRDVRTIAMGHYSIFYKKATDKIIVVAFWDNRQNPKKLLRLLKKS